MNGARGLVENATRQAGIASHDRSTERTKAGRTKTARTTSSYYRSALLTSVFLAALPGSALASTYTASDEATLRQAIANANADTDASSTITLTSNIVLSSATAFPAAAKPITINSGTFTLQGSQGVGTTGRGTSLSFGGGNLTLVGAFAGGSAATVNSTAAGSTGVIMTGGSVSVAGRVTGGAGGNTTRTGTAGRNSGAGGVGMATTNVQVVNQAGSTITGGAGGVYDQGNFAFSQDSNLGAGGTGLTMTNGTATSGSLDNKGVIQGGAGGTAINLNSGAYTTNGGAGGAGATITGGTHVNSGTIAGGIGGAGLSRSGISASGPGGNGLNLAQGVMTNSGTIAGGNGRAGGAGIVLPGGTAGSQGGVGVALTGGSTLTNTGTIRGGNAGGTISIPGDAITGNGNVTVINSGTITAGTGALFAPANAITFTGGNNTLLLYAGSTITGDVVGTGTDQLLLRGTGNASLTGAQYQGFGKYEKLDSATWTLTGTATNVTPWTVTGGVLAVSADANLGATSGALTLNGGTLQVTGTAFTSMARSVRLTAASSIDIASAANTLATAQPIIGAGALTKLGAGTLAMAGASTYTGGTTITAGTLQIGTGGTTGSIVGDVTNNARLALNRSNAITFAGVISGTGTVAQLGTGTTTLTGTNTYTGGTSITAGSLSLGNGGTSGSIIGDVSNAGTLVFNRSDSLDFAGAISGTGAVAQTGTGVTTLTGTSTYTGGTTIAAGTLQIGNGGTTGSIVGDVSNAGTLVFNRGDALEFAGAISGAGAVNQVGAGTTTLTGNSGALTGAVTVTGGTLAVNGTLGSAASTVAVSNGATLGGVGTIGGNVTIADGVLSPGNGAGTLTINGNLTLGAATQVNYELGSANTVGGALNDLTVVGGNLTLDGTLNVSQSAGGTYGAGIYRLFNYAGTLTDNGLTLGTMPAGTANYVQTSVANQVNLVNSQGLTLNFWDGDTGGRNDGIVSGGSGTWSANPTGGDQWTQADGRINGPYQNPSFAIFSGTPGTVTVDNSFGQIAVTGLQFATSGYRIQGGNVALAAGTNTIRVGDGTTAGASTIGTIASALTGAGGLDKTDTGTLVLSGTNTYGGGTRISGGTLQLGEGGTTGSIVGNVTNNGTLALNRSDANTISGVISGTGTVAQIGTGTTTLAGVNTYTGGTVIAAGTLTGSATSFGSGNITNNARLVISQPGDATFANAINGSGTFAKTGAGTLTLTGTSGLTGATTVTQGTLAVSGSLASSAVTVGNGATLTGTGTVGATTLQTGSTITPGAGSIGTLNVRGNFAQAAGSTFQVQVDPATLSSADRISVTGTATIASGAVLNVTRTGTSPYALNSKYTVLSATGGVSGKYTLTGDTRTAFVQLIDTYDANTAYLTASQFRSFTAAAQSPNQTGAAGALDTLDASSPLRNALAFLTDDGSARAAFDQLSGEQHASAQTALINDSRFVREAATDRLLGAFCSPGAASAAMADAGSDRGGCAPTTGGAVWGRAFASSGRFDGDGNARTVKRDIGGFFLGADTTLAGGWRIGALGGFSHTTLKGSAKTDDYHAGAYAGNQWGNTSLRLGASYTWHTLDTRRSVAFSGFADSLSAKYDGSTAQVFGEVGQRLDMAKGVAIEPIAGLAYVNVKTDGYTERGGPAALTAGKASFDTTVSTLGARFDASLGDRTALRGLLGWRHTFGDVTPEVTQAFAGSAPFTVSGVPLARDVAVIEAGVETALRPNLRLSASYSGQFGDALRDNGPKISLSYRF